MISFPSFLAFVSRQLFKRHSVNNPMQISSDLECLVVDKAKKKDGYYLCPICAEEKQPFVIVINKAKVLKIKETSNTVVIKSKYSPSTRFMDDLNEKILDIVRINSPLWFNSSIDNDLIDEYYISTLQYDKKQGETIRLKCINIDDFSELQEQSKCLDIVFTLKHLKFYRQKFFAEFQIESLSINDEQSALFLDDESDDENVYSDEMPVPPYEEILVIKKDCLEKLDNFGADLQSQVQNLKDKLREIELCYERLAASQKLESILIYCDEGERLMCA